MTSSRFRAALFGVLLGPAYVSAQSVADPAFDYAIAQPRYGEQKGPRILYDEGHNNPLSLKGQYAAFGRVLEADGYRLATHSGPLTADALAAPRVFVTVNAMYELQQLDLPTGSVYRDEEVEALYTRVHRPSGALYLIPHPLPLPVSGRKIEA